MARGIGRLAALGAFWAGCALADPTPAPVAPPATPAPSAAAGTEGRPFGLARIAIKLPTGKAWQTIQGGYLCLGSSKVVWTSGQEVVKNSAFVDAFRTEMEAAGFKVDGDGDNLFEPTASTSDLQVGAVIQDGDFGYCLPRSGLGDRSTIKGGGQFKIEWQVYSTLQKTVIARITTDGSTELKTSTPGGVAILLVGAFRENARALAASAEFRKAVAAQSPAGEPANPSSRTPIKLAGALAAKPRPLSDSVASVVLISAGQADGSGFLVSSDGMLLTDRHVVGDARYVKVRWPDGLETLGEVVRSDKKRDVALVKTDARGRAPLPLRRDPLQQGDSVYAVGAPLDEKFQTTMTRGIVSAYRTFEGLNYIQSDVSVNHGSSGGPLLDDKGQVVGMTESGLQIAGAPTNINLFTPIGDALDFLAASPN